MKSILLVLLVAGACLTTCPIAHGGLGTTTGREPGCWDKAGYSVILAWVGEVRQPDADDVGLCRAVVAPIATLAGAFDASLRPALKVAFHAGVSHSSIPKAPAKGDVVLAVISIPQDRPAGPEDPVLIVSDLCTFMPDEAALVILKNLDDPRVMETLKRIQRARAPLDLNEPHPLFNPPPKAEGTRNSGSRPSTNQSSKGKD